MGVGWMAIAASSQFAVGLYGGSANRVRAFSVMSIGFSVSSFLGPLIAGFMIDHVSYQAAFGVLAAFPAVAAILFATKLLKLPVGEPRTRSGGGRISVWGIDPVVGRLHPDRRSSEARACFMDGGSV
jgi:MFS family permease